MRNRSELSGVEASWICGYTSKASVWAPQQSFLGAFSCSEIEMRKWGKEVWDFARRKSVRKEDKAMFITEVCGCRQSGDEGAL